MADPDDQDESDLAAENTRLKAQVRELKQKLDRAERHSKVGPRAARAAELNASGVEPGTAEDEHPPGASKKEAIIRPGDKLSREPTQPLPRAGRAIAPPAELTLEPEPPKR